MRLYFILVMLILFLSPGCSWVKFPSVHKVSVHQGNIVSQDMVDKLKIGMSKTQVQYILGSPLLVDTFNPSRWDYYYTKVDSKSNKIRRLLTLRFNSENTLISLDGDYLISHGTSDYN